MSLVHRALRISGALAVLGVALGSGLPAQAGSPDAALVYRRFAARVVKIQSIEKRSGAKSAIGSGFFVSGAGHVVTNYHVVSELINRPERYRAELVDGGERSRPVEVLAIDVVHDLAVLQAGPAGDPWFTLAPASPDRGTRLYSMGHPHDLGLSIVEGTYNGLLEHTLYPKIHFTGSINPGMSGGPTVNAEGTVVGVNVSTAGEQVSFLVPVDRVIALVDEATRPGYVRPDSLLRTVAQQLLSYQDTYLARLFADSARTVTLGGYQVPTEPAPFFKCWGDASHSRTRPYETIEHQCSTDDYVFISGEQSSGVLTLQHTVLSTRDLNRFRFYSLLTSQFSGDGFAFQGREVVTPRRCTSGNVRQPGLALATVFCTRRYRKLDGLYDVFFKAATLGDPSSGLITTLTLSGVTFENARRVVERFLASLGRAPE
ncbi:MAG: serine protease [Gemmatimonadota bacterium]|nr:serine protease [Gemmatimonadota bacterium]